MFNTPITFDSLEQFPNVGIIALKDETNKAVYCFHSYGMLNELIRIISELQRGTFSNRKLQKAYNNHPITLEVVKSFDPAIPKPEVVKSTYTQIVEDFKKLGYANMRESFRSLKFKLKIRLMQDFRDHRYTNHEYVKPLVYVTAKAATKTIVLAVFDNIPEAEKWVYDKYGGAPGFVIPEYCDNELTKQYLEANGPDLIKLRYRLVCA